MIKAIQTRYKGYNFRSRLEARWAVFFDALGIKWEYEPEGFELPNGERYLPDFKIQVPCDFEQPPKMRWNWVEIKAITPTSDELMRMHLLVKGQYLGHFEDGGMGFLFAGDPLECETFTFCGCGGTRSKNCSPNPLPHRCSSNTGYYSLMSLLPFSQFDMGDHDGSINPCSTTRVIKAANAARSARFEFGESGATV